MGWGCYRHEVDAESDNWKAQVAALIPDGRSHGKPFDWGRDSQVCPFCWVELEQIKNVYQKALGEIQLHPERAEMVALHAFEEAEKIELHPGGDMKNKLEGACVNDHHRGTECRCGHMVAHCCSHHCCCFYFCKSKSKGCRHADHEHKEGGACGFGGSCSCKKYVGEIRGRS